MKNKFELLFAFFILHSVFNLSAHAQGTAFTYQGRLNSGGSPADGSYDLTFSLFATNASGVAIAGPVTNTAVAVSNGLFTTTVNFGNAFAGASNWLEIGVSTNGANVFLTLSPRQQVTPTPYAITAENVVGLTVQQNTNGSPNVIEGSSVNYVSNSVYGATIAGGGTANFSNSVTADFGTVGGGGANTASGWASTVGGGAGNIASSPDGSATVGGGYYNTASGDSATVGGGDANTASGYYATVGGGAGNTDGSPYATIGGGGYNFIGTNSNSGTISGGFANQIADNTHDSAIGGGSFGSIGSNSFASTLAGGSHNSIGSNASVAAIGGGTNNTASGIGATVAGGSGNSAAGSYAAIGGGNANTASGLDATVPGGSGNVASGANSFAAGTYANATYPGSFVWSDDSSNSYFFSTAANQFSVRAVGGVRFETAGAGMTLDGQPVALQAGGNTFTGNQVITNGNVGIGTTTPSYPLDVNGSAYIENSLYVGVYLGVGYDGIYSEGPLNVVGNVTTGDLSLSENGPYHNLSLSGGNSTGYLYGSYAKWGDGVHLGYNYYADANGTGHIPATGGGTSRISADYGEIVLAVGAVNTAPSSVRLDATTAGVTVYGTFNNLSDRNAKQDFAPVSASQILDKVLQLPISEWSYKEDSKTRHIGPVAQDFHAVFNIGTDDRHIAPIDEGGIAFAAIQGLNQKLNERDAEIRDLRQSVADLKKMVQSLAEKR